MYIKIVDYLYIITLTFTSFTQKNDLSYS